MRYGLSKTIMALSVMSVIEYSFYFFFLLLNIPRIDFKMKYTISTPLISENPVNRPIVPPITESLVSAFALSSCTQKQRFDDCLIFFHTFMITSKVGVLKDIFTSLRFTLCWNAKKENAHHKSLLYGRVLTIEKPKFTQTQT